MTRDVIASVAGAFAVVLAAAGLLTVVEDGVWFAWCILTIVLVVATGQLLTWRRVNSTFISMAQIAVVAYTALWSCSASMFFLYLIPTKTAVVSAVRQVTAAASDVQQYAPPIGGSQGLTVVMILLIGFSAVCMDVLASELKSPVLSGFVLILLHVVPMSVLRAPAPWWTFLFTAVGFFVVLAAVERDALAKWGPSLSGAYPMNLTPGMVGVAVLACVAALVAPLAFGSTTDDRFVRAGGGGTISITNPMFDLRNSLKEQSDMEILRYDTTDQTPAPLRLAVVDTYNGNTFQPTTSTLSRDNTVQSGISAVDLFAAENVSEQEVTSAVTITTLSQSAFLPVQDEPKRVEIDGRWLYDDTSLNILGSGVTVEPGLEYTVQSSKKSFDPDQLDSAAELPPEIVTRWTTLTPALSADLQRETNIVTGDGKTPYAMAVALQQHFRQDGGFTYSLDVPDFTDGRSVISFLNQKRGFCVHYASAMALMARSAGIPSRVVTGYLPGEKTEGATSQDGRSTYVVRGKDAHAWPELYFQGAGWVRFEPTPSNHVGTLPGWTVQGEQAPLPEPTVDTPTQEPSSQPSNQTSAAPGGESARDPRFSEGNNGDPKTENADTEAQPTPWWVWLLVGAIAALVLAVAAVMWLRARRAKQLAAAATSGEAMWKAMLDDLADLGMVFPPASTEKDIARSLTHSHDGDVGSSVAVLEREVEKARYQPAGRSEGASPEIAQAHKVVVSSVAQAQTMPRRVLASLLPGVARKIGS